MNKTTASNKLLIGVASHKPYWMPEDAVYQPIWVGAVLHDEGIPAGWLRDDEGENISAKNKNYCELTALYWLWKHADAEYVGLAHYRRYFAAKAMGEKKARIATGSDIEMMLEKNPVILPKKRNYFIETNYSQYVHAHHEEDLAATRAVLAEKYPEFLAAYDASMKRTTGHRFNMFVMRKDILNDYCAWLFDVLGTVEERLDISSYSDNDKRVFGFLSERLLDPWIETKGISYAEMPVVNLESQHWLNKGANFLKRKFFGVNR